MVLSDTGSRVLVRAHVVLDLARGDFLRPPARIHCRHPVTNESRNRSRSGRGRRTGSRSRDRSGSRSESGNGTESKENWNRSRGGRRRKSR